MSIKDRLKFMMGILFVFVLVGGLVLFLNQSMSKSQSIKGELAADTSSIGTDYAGLVVEQKVKQGDKVSKGQKLFEIDSPRLKEALGNDEVSVSTLPFDVDPDTSRVILKASDNGIVEKIHFPLGSYAPMGSIVATINTASSLYAVSNFRLSPPDYARINKKGIITITLPDNSQRQSTIFDVSFARNGDAVDTVVKSRLTDAGMEDFRFSVGTPVQVSLPLGQDTWYEQLLNIVQRLFQPVGNRN